MEAEIYNTIALATLNMTKDEQRTLNQNRALHRYFELVAQELKAGGFTVNVIFKEMPDVEITPHIVKEMWRSFQKTLVGKDSTAKLNTKEVNQVYEEFNRFTAEHFWTSIGFPSEEEQSLQDEHIRN